MTSRTVKRLAFGVALAAWLILLAPGRTTSRAAAPPDEKPAEQVFKNIQVFKGLPESQLWRAMFFISASLGVDCSHCHVAAPGGEDWPYEKDDKPAKRTARKMILMTREIDEKSFGGALVVTCATCHQGRVRPASIPPVAEVGAKPAAEAPKPAGPLPSVDQLLDRYVAALGGREAVRGVSSRLLRGVLVTMDGATLPLEVDAKAPDKLLVVTGFPRGSVLEGYDGSVGWQKGPDGQFEMSGLDLDQFAYRARFYRDLELTTHYTKMSVSGTERIGDREAYVVEASSGPGASARLYFDTQTGLLLRVAELNATPLGPLPDVTDYDDYRKVDGVAVPFVVRRSTPNWAVIQRFSEVKQNAALDAAKFAAPGKS